MLNIEKKEEFLNENVSELDPVLNAINKYKIYFENQRNRESACHIFFPNY